MTMSETVGREAALPLSPPARQLREPGWLGRMVAAGSRVTWAHRWQLAPVAGGVVVFVLGATGHALPTALALLGAAGAAGWASTWKKRDGRMWLSLLERRYLAEWAGAAAAWTVLSSQFAGAPVLSVGALTAATAWPAWRWARSRQPKRPDKDAKLIADRWAATFAHDDNPQVRGSTVDLRRGVTYPGPGASVFTVQLPDGVHSDNCGETLRRYIEARLRLPQDVVQIRSVRDDSTLLRVAISPNRHLEGTAGATWPGPILEPSGFIPLADSQDGSVSGIDLYDQSGVAHVWINGRTNGGKSTSLAAVVLPGLCAGHELVLYADGKRGNSLPAHLAPFMTKVARDLDEWRAAIRTAHAVMEARQIRRGAQEIADWHVPSEPEPVVTLVLEEAPKLNRMLPKAEKDMVTNIGEQGRSVGVRLIEVTQGPQVWKLVGDVRGNLTQVIAHRPGDGGEAKLAITSGDTTVQVDPMKLPGEPGWAVVVRWGQITHRARVRYATPDAIRKLAEGFTPRQLEGADLEAAGTAYLRWGAADVQDDTPLADPPVVLVGDNEPEETPEQSRDTRDVLVSILRKHGPLKLGEIEEHPDWHRSRKTASNHLKAMFVARTATQTTDGWVLTGQESA